MSYLSDGCGSCSTIGGFNEVPANQVNFVDPGSQMVSHMVAAQQRAQRNAMQAQSIHQQEQQLIDAQVINAKLSDAFNNNPPPPNPPPQQPQSQPPQPPAKQPTQPVAQPPTQPKPKANDSGKMFGLDMKNMVIFGLVIVIALGWNETAKYHINQAIKYNDGSPYYYAGYVIAMIALAFLACNYFKKM